MRLPREGDAYRSPPRQVLVLSWATSHAVSSFNTDAGTEFAGFRHSRIYAGGTFSGDCHHRHPCRSAVAGRPGGSRSVSTIVLRKCSQANWRGVAKLPFGPEH